jgi:type IX secretion system PorP/SprF family membrane protein
MKTCIPGNCAFACLLVFFILPSISLSQDIHYSQFESSPLNLNPANTGAFNGDYRFSANHRKQWKSVTAPFNTFSGSFDMVLGPLSQKKTRYSAGIQLNNDRAGDSRLGLFQAALSFSVMQPVGSDSVHFLSAGIQAGYVQRSINYSDLTFDQQFDGDNYNPSSGNGESFSSNQHGYFDFSTGISYMYRKSERLKAGTGISVQHVNRPQDSFFGEKIKMFSRIQAELHADAAIATRVDIVPALLFMKQGSFREFTAGTSIRYRFSEKPGKQYAFLVGGWLRKSDAFIASAGVEYNNLNVGVSYDFNTSDLERASNGKGGYELSLIYIIRKVKSTGIKPPCPLY